LGAEIENQDLVVHGSGRKASERKWLAKSEDASSRNEVPRIAIAIA
jgi:hypothetical protein